ncbi:hypothetical protein FM102_02230 [Corynebacterium glutamicum]|nr:hypothetical protein FM102_02230 [Corynebacterium glutamicum]
MAAIKATTCLTVVLFSFLLMGVMFAPASFEVTLTIFPHER